MREFETRTKIYCFTVTQMVSCQNVRKRLLWWNQRRIQLPWRDLASQVRPFIQNRLEQTLATHVPPIGYSDQGNIGSDAGDLFLSIENDTLTDVTKHIRLMIVLCTYKMNMSQKNRLGQNKLNSVEEYEIDGPWYSIARRKEGT